MGADTVALPPNALWRKVARTRRTAAALTVQITFIAEQYYATVAGRRLGMAAMGMALAPAR